MSISPDLQISPDGSSADPDETRAFVDNPEIAKILDQYLHDLQNGTACSRQELLERHPELADELAEYLDGIEMVAGLGVGSDLIPQRLGDFEIVEQIGQGAMGVVYRAKQISLKRPVALKVLRYAVTGKQSTKRFEREAELVATLDHPHIVPVHAFGQHESLNFFAMQLIDGQSLAQWNVDNLDQRDPVAIAKWIAQVARALAHAHQRDVVHRDVKPSNLLKDQDDKIWLTDFGLARRFDDVRMSMTGAMLGTPNYMSPEQAAPARHPIDHRTDIYSLGATLFELLTGRTVFVADTPHAVLAQVLAEEAPLLSELIPDVSRDLETIVMKCLEKESRARYQTANELADDLEAFAEGQNIKARRPSVLERFTRWKRQNQKAVSWASTAIAATISVLMLGISTWVGVKNASEGKLVVESSEGPIVGQLIDEDGETLPAFTIPTQQEMSLNAGRYKLQMWAGGRVGETLDLFVDRGDTTTIDVKLPRETVFPERTVEGIPQVWSKPNGDDIVYLHKKGITLVDARSGKDIWTTDVKEISKELAGEIAQKKASANNSVPSFRWELNEGKTHGYLVRRIPKITTASSDLNGDRAPDLVILCHKQLVMFAIDGLTGKLLWRYTAQPNAQKGQFDYSYAGGLHSAEPVGDVDGDGVTDYAAGFFCHGLNVTRWQDVVSGKTGQRLWRLDMPTEWFAETKTSIVPSKTYIVPTTCKISRFDRYASFFPDTVYHGSDWKCRTYRDTSVVDTVVPWPARIHETHVGTEKPDGSLLLACGSKLVCRKVSDGSPSSFNDGKPLELGFFPAFAPKIVQAESGEVLGVLLCEQVVIANQRTKTAARMRFSLWSLDTAEKVWHYDAACDASWTPFTPDWPIVRDFNDDGIPEILVVDGADLQTNYYEGASCSTSIQILDVKTGKPRWPKENLVKIRNVERQIQNLVVGPDADGDGKDDIYVLSPMARATTAFKYKTHLFVDILSGVSGALIRTVETQLPESGESLIFETPFFWGHGSDGSALLVVGSLRVGRDLELRANTVLLSTGTGELVHYCRELEHPLQVDHLGNGDTSLLTVRALDRSDITTSGQMVLLQSLSRESLKIAGRQYVSVGDLNDDGVQDLTTSDGMPMQYALSGSDGSLLWKTTLAETPDNVINANGDVDGDGVNDLLTWPAHRNRQNFAQLSALSGRTGKQCWTTPVRLDHSENSLNPVCQDIDNDGSLELIFISRSSKTAVTPGRSALLLQCLDATSGQMKWFKELAAAGTAAANTQYKAERWPIRIVDINGDGKLEIVTVAYDQSDFAMAAVWTTEGKLLWQCKTTGILAKGRLKPWLVEVVPVGPVTRKGIQNYHLVAVGETGARTAGKNTIQARWFSGETGKLASQVTLEGSLPWGPSFNASQRDEHWNGVPFAIEAGDKNLTGLCVAGQGQALEVIVFESTVPLAHEIRRIQVDSGLFAIADVNQDTQQEVVFYQDQALVAVTLSSGKEVLRREVKADDGGIFSVDRNRQMLNLFTSVGSEHRMKSIELRGLRTHWDVRLHIPMDYDDMTHLTGANNSQTATGPKGPPPVLMVSVNKRGHRGIRSTTRLMTARPDEYHGDEESIVAEMAADINAASISVASPDSRMIQPLPWAGGEIASELLKMIGSMFFVTLGAILLPYYFLRYLLFNRTWSLRAYLLLPLMIAIPYLVLQLPVEQSLSSPQCEVARHLSAPLWVAKLITALLLLPPIALIQQCFSQWQDGRWKTMGWTIFAVITLSVLWGGMLLIGYRQQMPAGTRYNFADWGSLILIVVGVWGVGLANIAWACLKAIWRMIRRIPIRREKVAVI